MKSYKKYIKLPEKLVKKIVAIPREKHHPILHYVRKRHQVSRSTLFYMKEYGPRSHVVSVIIKESIWILLLTSLISTIGGLGLEVVKQKLFTIIPLLILLPALNDMMGDYGTIVSSKFTTALFEGQIKEKWWRSKFIHSLATTVLVVSVISGLYISALAYALALLQGFPFTLIILQKVIGVTLIAVSIIVSLIFLVSVLGGLLIYKLKHDPNNFLIPITTAVADIGSMLVFSVLVALLF